jgi:tryptophan 2,3-dioxygenase
MITYRDYLQLPKLLESQTPLSDAHDELLFISIHQSSEIWMKLCLHELRAARRHIAADDLSPAFKMMARVARVQALLIQISELWWIDMNNSSSCASESGVWHSSSLGS